MRSSAVSSITAIQPARKRLLFFWAQGVTMFDRLVADGDCTTTGGAVIGRSDFYNEEGKMYARKENKATCGNCKGAWPIHGTANNWMDNGLPYVKHMDRVLCPCENNFVLASGSSNSGYSDGKEKVQMEKPIMPPDTGVYDEQFILTDATGNALADTWYTVRLPSGGFLHGVTDSSGKTERCRTDVSHSINFYLGHAREI